MKILSFVKNGKRVDIPQDEFRKMVESAGVELAKGGPGSGRYPAGSGKGKGDEVTGYRVSSPRIPGGKEFKTLNEAKQEMHRQMAAGSRESGISEIKVKEEMSEGQKKVSDIMDNIVRGNDKYYGYAHFDVSNMADYPTMSDTINDMAEVYGIDPAQAADIVQALTHDHSKYKEGK